MLIPLPQLTLLDTALDHRHKSRKESKHKRKREREREREREKCTPSCSTPPINFFNLSSGCISFSLELIFSLWLLQLCAKKDASFAKLKKKKKRGRENLVSEREERERERERERVCASCLRREGKSIEREREREREGKALHAKQSGSTDYGPCRTSLYFC